MRLSRATLNCALFSIALVSSSVDAFQLQQKPWLNPHQQTMQKVNKASFESSISSSKCATQLSPSSSTPPVVPPPTLEQLAKRFVASALLVLAALTSDMTHANASPPVLGGPLEQAIVEATDASYPILEKSLTRPENVNPLANKLTKIVTNKIPPSKSSLAFEKAIDALLGIDNEDFSQFSDTIKQSYSSVSTDSCTLIPIPTAAIDTLVHSDMVQGVDPTKLEAITKRILPTLEAIPNTLSSSQQQEQQPSICLPTRVGLEDISKSQTQLTLALPRQAARDFVSAANSAVGSVSPSEFLRLLPDFKQLTKGVDAKTVNRAQSTNQQLNKILQTDQRFARLAGKQAK